MPSGLTVSTRGILHALGGIAILVVLTAGVGCRTDEVAGGTLYFTASDGASGKELWKSDGTAAGTMIVKDISPGASDSDPRYLTAAGTAP